MNDRPRVAFVDDDAELRNANQESLELAGFEVYPFADAESALAFLDADFPGVVVSDIRMPRIDGLELFQRLKALDADLPVILITGHGDVPMAVAALHDGAYDFIAKPYGADRLVQSVSRAAEKRRLVLENRRLRLAAQSAEESLPLIGQTPAMENLRRTIRHIADTEVDVLIAGETGSGKEVVASLLHEWSSRRSGNFVAVNCGALPESMIESELFGHEAGAFTGAQKKRIGRIEHSSGGTLFLDEIESMPPAAQVRLLRVLEQRTIEPLGSNESRELSLRVVAASKIDLGNPVQRGDFREDLYYRLNVVTVSIPPLRERKEDIPLLFAHFMQRAAARFGIEVPQLSPQVSRYLFQHDWPGNVRELAHFAERLALGLGDVIAPPATLRIESGHASLPARLEQYEADLIREALLANAGDVRSTLETLGIPRKTFYDKLQRHGIDRAQYVRKADD
ncbi:MULTISPECIES: sigma-54-dependent transcriptional regulator [Pseudomonadaceae]|uniref:Sigma-54-dependent Fis family transcriptional regulator n=1 Tax=Stutzerimonas degradans TaxID=2968968 RepID=A0A8E2QD87_9GAMM|nr:MULTISPECIES: sigma-54 dependent transcriptional regulator [Pseudomonadaceae]KGK81179.1 Fis family transcriptional regulator [Stutzerimonas degradans]MCQ4267944.1 sigma-54 dependent transcriptional regulator [Stutzerimonas degradans]MCQ4276428.1 sigma-54 dependent transcriptional regulator [Stutzerimonas degradans]PNF75870.1 sigma-54-dependent Fis family transcriptional regulator [Stutzerimonas degradans]QGW21616.1 response regulator [Stutzerimonas degradans]